MHYEAAGSWHRTVSALRAGALHSRERNAYQESTQLLGHALRVAENLGEPERSVLTNEIDAELQSVRKMLARSISQQQKAS